MPMFMDFHNNMTGATTDQIKNAHELDVAVQGKYGVSYQYFWVNEKEGHVFCLMQGPDLESCKKVHHLMDCRLKYFLNFQITPILFSLRTIFIA